MPASSALGTQQWQSPETGKVWAVTAAYRLGQTDHGHIPREIQVVGPDGSIPRLPALGLLPSLAAQHLHYLPTIHRGPVQMITRSCDLLLKTSTGFPKYSEENPILFYHGPQRTVIWGLLSTLTSPRTAITCSLHTQVSSYFRAFALASPRGCAPDFTWPTPSCQSCLNPNVTSGEASANHPEHCQPLVLSWALFPPDSVSCCLCLTWRGRPALGQQRPHRLSSLSLLRSARWFSTTSWWTC